MTTFHYRGSVFKIKEQTYSNQISKLCNAAEDLYLPEESDIGKLDGTVYLTQSDTDYQTFANVRRLYIPGYVSELIADNEMFPNLEEIIIADDNETYQSIGPMLVKFRDLALYNLSHELIYVFSAGMGECCTVPSQIDVIGAHAFRHTKCHQIVFDNPHICYHDTSFDESQWLSDDVPYRIINNTFFRCLKPGPKLCIPDDVKQICRTAFRECRSTIEELISPFPLDKDLLGDMYFTTSILKHLKRYILKDANAMDLSMLGNFSNLESIEIQDSNGTSPYKTIDGVLFSKDMKTLHTYPANKQDQTYQMPDGIEVIESFCRNNHLQHLTMPDTVTEIKPSCFEKCLGLTSIRFSDNLTEIPDNACNDCSSLRNVHYPLHLEKIGKHAFTTCPLKTLDIPSTWKTICQGAFSFNPVLTELSVPQTLHKIEDSAFMHSEALQTITLPAIAYDGNIFKKCSKLKIIDLHDGIKSIPECMFTDCTSLEQITLPASVECIEAYAFARCSELKSINFPPNLTTIQRHALANCSLIALELPQGIQEIGDHALLGYDGSVNLPNTLSSLKQAAFLDVSTLTVDASMPASVFEAAYSEGSRNQPLKLIIHRDGSEQICHLSKGLDIQTIQSLNQLWRTHGFDQIEPTSFKGIQDKDEKYAYAIERYNSPKANAVYKNHLIRVIIAKSRYLIREHKESELIKLLNLKLLSKANLQKLLKLMTPSELPIATAYILKFLQGLPEAPSSLEL